MAKEQRLILTADTNRRNQELLYTVFSQHGYGSLPVCSLAELDHALADPSDIALAMVDLGGFDRTIWDRCERLRSIGIPFLVVSPRQSTAVQTASLSHGARGVYVKPLAMKALLVLIQTLTHEHE